MKAEESNFYFCLTCWVLEKHPLSAQDKVNKKGIPASLDFFSQKSV